MSDEERGIAAVTGAGGFLGAVVCERLREQGIPVRGIVRRAAAREALERTGVEAVVADIRDSEAVRTALDGCTHVYHVAALFRSHGVPDREFWDVNVEGTRNVLAASEACGVAHVVHCSTVGVHSDIPDPPADETEPYRPADIYQVTKCEGEKLARSWFEEGRLSGTVIRPAMIWGPGDARTLKLFRGVVRKRLPIIGSGKVPLHWVLVQDVADAMLRAASVPEARGQTYIIAGERSVTIEELYGMIAAAAGVEPWKLRIPAPPVQLLGEIVERICRPLGIEPPIYRRRVDFFTKARSFDCSRAARELGFRPRYTLEEEIALILESYRSLGLL